MKRKQSVIRQSVISLRHRAEMPLLYLCVLISVLVLAGSAALVLAPDVTATLGLGALAEDATGIVVFAPLVPFAVILAKFYTAATARANGIKVGPEQFPEIYRQYLALAEKIGVAPVPELYVINGNGVVNAYALSCNARRNYVVLHAEIAMLNEKRPQVVDFVLAHELGHHKLHHVSLFRILVNIIPGFMVLPQRAAIRAQEYSADRVAMHACGSCTESMGLLAVGPFLEHRVNIDAYARQADEEDKSWFVRLVHWLSDHAVNTKRLRALRLIEQHGFDRHGSMF